MRVEITEERLKDTDATTDQHYVLTKGDIVTVPDECGQRWCSYGWAKDTEGVVPTGERIPGARAPLAVQNSKVGAPTPTGA